MKFQYKLELSGVKPGYSDLVYIRAGASSISYTAGQKQYGAAITVSSFNSSVFEESTVQFQDPIDKKLKMCAKLFYKYSALNNIANPATNKFYNFVNQKFFYLAVCPIDLQFDLTTSAADIVVTKAKFPSHFVASYPLSSTFSYALSTGSGELVAFRNEDGFVPAATGQATCASAATVTALAPGSSGVQILAFPLKLISSSSVTSATTSQYTLPMDAVSSGLHGFGSLRVVIKLSTALGGLDMLTLPGSACLMQTGPSVTDATSGAV